MAGDHGGPGKPGFPNLPVQRPAGEADQHKEARRNPVGHLSPEPGRQRAPLLPVQRSRGHPIGDSGVCGRFPVAYRNGVRDRKGRRGAGRIRDPHLVRLASPHGHVPAGRSLSVEPGAGLGEKMARITRPQVYRVVREMLPRERFGPRELLQWLEESLLRNERASRSLERRRSARHQRRMEPPP